MHHRALAAVQEHAREVIAGALAGLRFPAVALQAGLVVICPPRDGRCGSDTEDMGGADLASATSGWRIDTCRR